jgi:hypothetical protein
MEAGYNQKKIEAHKFGLNILMPEYQFRYQVESGKYSSMAFANFFWRFWGCFFASYSIFRI